MPDDIRFYRTADAYGCFSNFQAQKFQDSDCRERIPDAPSPMIDSTGTPQNTNCAWTLRPT
jgi:predicted NAD-dependent protein-ADP-ribosyltransferase YbiA (DUF1768 family)